MYGLKLYINILSYVISIVLATLKLKITLHLMQYRISDQIKKIMYTLKNHGDQYKSKNMAF